MPEGSTVIRAWVDDEAVAPDVLAVWNREMIAQEGRRRRRAKSQWLWKSLQAFLLREIVRKMRAMRCWKAGATRARVIWGCGTPSLPHGWCGDPAPGRPTIWVMATGDYLMDLVTLLHELAHADTRWAPGHGLPWRIVYKKAIEEWTGERLRDHVIYPQINEHVHGVDMDIRAEVMMMKWYLARVASLSRGAQDGHAVGMQQGKAQ